MDHFSQNYILPIDSDTITQSEGLQTPQERQVFCIVTNIVVI